MPWYHNRRSHCIPDMHCYSYKQRNGPLTCCLIYERTTHCWDTLRKSKSHVGYSSLFKAKCKHTEFKLGGVNYNSTVDNLSNMSQPFHSLFYYLPRCKSSYNIHYLMVSASIRINLITFMDLTLDAFPFSSDSYRILLNASVLFNCLFAPNRSKGLSTLKTNYCACHGIC